jgi:hypothetical protein
LTGFPLLESPDGKRAITYRRTITAVLGPGQSRVYSLESPEDEVFLHFDPPVLPDEAELREMGAATDIIGARNIQPTKRLRHGEAYELLGFPVGNIEVVHTAPIAPEVLPAHVAAQLSEMYQTN